MPKYCFVPGCKTTRYKSKPGDKRLTFFTAPKDPLLRKKWHFATRRADKELNERDVVCELHFSEDCIERYYTTELYDGSIFKLERGVPALKKGSIPTIFPFNSKPNSVSRRRRAKKVVQNKENGRGDFELRKISSPSKSPSQVLACSAYGCTNSSDKKKPGISFHRFPTNKTREKWIQCTGRKDWQPSKKSVLCSAHFAPDQIKRILPSVYLKSGAIPTIFSFGEKQQMTWLPGNLQTDFNDSSDSDRNESCFTGINDFSVQDSDEVPLTGKDYFIKKEIDEIPEEMSSSSKNMSSKYFISENLIVQGHEEVFGKFVANELKILSCDPHLYLRTKEKIWQVLEEATQMYET